jgi:hypothetical protein
MSCLGPTHGRRNFIQISTAGPDWSKWHRIIWNNSISDPFLTLRFRSAILLPLWSDQTEVNRVGLRKYRGICKRSYWRHTLCCAYYIDWRLPRIETVAVQAYWRKARSCWLRYLGKHTCYSATPSQYANTKSFLNSLDMGCLTQV